MPYNNQNTTTGFFVVARLNIFPSLNFTKKTVVLVLHILVCPRGFFPLPNLSQRRGTSPRSSQCDHWSLFKPPRGEGDVGFHPFETGTLAIHVRGVFFLPFLPKSWFNKNWAIPPIVENSFPILYIRHFPLNHDDGRQNRHVISTKTYQLNNDFPWPLLGVYPINKHIPTCTRYIFPGEQLKIQGMYGPA